MTFREPFITPSKRQFQQQTAPDGILPTNPNLFTNPIPFSQTDWPRVHSVILYVPDTPHTDINFYPNPIPFKLTEWPRIQSVKLAPPQPQPNITVLNTVVVSPFYTQDFATSHVMPDWTSPVQYPNIVLQNPVQSPFYIQDFATSHVTPDYIPPPQYPNLALQNFSTPFYTSDFPKPFFPASVKSDQQTLNVNIYTNPIPFGPYDQSKPIQVKSVLFDNLPNIALLNPPVVAVPFNQLSWPNTSTVPSAPFEIANMVLYTVDTTSAPFYTQDFSRPFVPVLVKSDQQSLNLNLYTNPIPLGPYDWSTSSFFFKNRAQAGQVGTPNFLLTNPFYGQDFSNTKFLPSIISPLMVNNVLLNQVVTNPFFFQDFSRPFVPPRAAVDVQSVNTNLFTNPVPLNQINWSKPYSIVPIASDQNSLPNLILYQPVPSNPSNPLGIYSWMDLYKYVTLYPTTPALLQNLTLILPPPPPDTGPVGGWRWIDGVMRMREKQLDRRDQNASAVMLGKLGGLARAQALTTKQRSNIASKAAQVRWNPPAKKR